MSRKLPAVTFIEIILVMAIFSSIAMVAMPVTVRQLDKDKINDKAADITSLIQLTQQRGYAGQDDSSFGIAFASGSYTIFRGPDLANADQSEAIPLPNGMTFSGITTGDSSGEVAFSAGDVRPSTTLNLTLSNSVETFQITVNSEGLVDYVRI